MSLLHSSRITLVPIEIRKDKKHYIVEDQLTGEFYEMPVVCIDAINLINQGEQLDEIERELKQKYPDEEVDLLEFAEQLQELDLIAEIDGVKLEKQNKKKEKLGMLWISSGMGKFFFNHVAYFVYFALFIGNIALLIIHPDLFPHYKDIFVFDVMFLNILLWMGLSVILVLIHEFGHVLAMRAYGLPTKLEIGHRLFLVVLETDMSSVWKLPSKERNALYLAGMCFDTVLLSIALISQLFLPSGSGIFMSIITLAVLDIFMRMLYQCCIYMKTDLYYVFENVTGCYNLMENGKQMIGKRLPFVKVAPSNEVILPGERNTVLMYSIFYFVGVALTIGLFTIFYIPQLFFAGKSILPGFEKSLTSLAFWDAAIFSLQILIVFFLLLNSWSKKYRRSAY